ncbi:MAG: chorismate synthase, partial [Methanosarcinales archaeon]|nr:chorismate synthase [Methanosarcinales archaeon]
ELDRRRPGQSDVSTPRSEADRVEILSGIFEGKTTGTPISMMVWNKDADSSKYEDLKDTPRPGHADYPYEVKYGIRDYRGGGRSSARETIGRVAGGAIAKKVLAAHGIDIVAHVTELGGVSIYDGGVGIETSIKGAGSMDYTSSTPYINTIKKAIESNPLRCMDTATAERMHKAVMEARAEGDSIGGIVEVIATGVPAGLGEPVFDKLDAEIAKAMLGIGAVKGIEFGAGFRCAKMQGSEMNDAFVMHGDSVDVSTNNAGGILGGLSSGAPIVCRLAVKPTPSISKTQKTVDLATGLDAEISIGGRHDPTIPPRLVPVAEAMMALVLADHLLRSKRYV